MKEYKHEVYVTICGAVLSFIQFFINSEYSFLILAFTVILDIAIIGIKSDIGNHIDSVDECQRMIHKLNNKRWRCEAEKLLNETVEQIKSMNNGIRSIPPASINNEELSIMESAQKSIKCTYYADSLIKLRMRLPNGSSNPLYSVLTGYSNKRYKKIEKKRVIIIGNLDIKQEEVGELIRKIHKFNSDKIENDGLEFEIRFVLISKLNELQIPLIGNLLMVDNMEASTVIDKTNYPEDYLDNNVQVLRDLVCNATINTVEINRLNNVFQRIWELALDIDHFLT